MPLPDVVSGLLLSDRPLVRTQPGVPKMTAVSHFLMVYSVFLLFWATLLTNKVDLLMRFFCPVFRMGPTSAIQQMTCEAVPTRSAFMAFDLFRVSMLLDGDTSACLQRLSLVVKNKLNFKILAE